MNFETYKRDGEYHYINVNYPGLVCIHKDPNIFVVHDFLTNSECDTIIDTMKDKEMVNAFISGGRQNLDYRKCLTKTIFKSYQNFLILKILEKK